MGTPARTLLVMRHADAATGRVDLADHDRPLTTLGLAQAMTRRAVIRSHAPQLVCCSTATRARQTLEELDLADGVGTVRLDERVYHADATALALLLAEVDVDVASVMLLGHLPAVSDLVRGLLRPEDRGGIGFAPATVAALGIDTTWDALAPGCANLLSLTG